MIQNSIFNDGDEKSDLKLTVSNDQFARSNDSRIFSADDCDAATTIKKVTSLRCNDLKSKSKNKNDHNQKAINAKLNLYKSAKNKFQLECNSLIQSYETIKKLQSEDDGLKLEDLETTVKDIVGKQFGIKFPKSNGDASNKYHAIFVSNPNRSSCLDIKSSTGHRNLDLAVKGIFEEAWKCCLDISETNAKYEFWLKLIIEPNHFCDLYAVREYLMKNMFNEEQTTEQTIESKLNTIYNHLQLKIIDIINAFNESLMPEKLTNEKNSVSIEKPSNEDDSEKCDTNAETKLQTAIEDYKHKMEAKLKLLETENQKLTENEAKYSIQIKTLMGELSFRNRKLSNVKERVALLTKEKTDLISTIEKIEVKDKSFQTLQSRYVKVQESNERLRSIIENEYNRVVI
ncbi:Hypothetical protein CINCED_3A003086 [Cinara cedri]|uniref:Uncharacterized protein n=1 Tax=Cinara cedri TaxID=506608 RepID=A0A5E4N4T8_9HEMI|nr:Hypothetical protein CINCED_3A003086 [Cinara cedri]